MQMQILLVLMPSPTCMAAPSIGFCINPRMIAGLGDLDDFFSDPDGDSLSYVAEVVGTHRDLILFKGKKLRKLVTAPNVGNHVVDLDILTERLDRPVDINIFAVDASDARSEDYVTFTFRNKQPIKRNNGHDVGPSNNG